MTLGPDDVRRLARLSALELPAGRPGPALMSDADVARYGRELGAILDHVRALTALDVEGVPPTSHGVPLPTALRPDVAGERLDHDRALAGAPRAVEGGFAVPKVIE